MAVAQSNKDSTRLAEQAYAFVGLLLMVGALKPVFSAGIGTRNQAIAALLTEGTLSYQIFSAGIYLIAFVILLPRYNDVITLVTRNKTLAFFVGLILISALWSDLSAVTLRRSLALLGTTVFAVYLTLRFSPSELLRLLALALGLTAVETLLFVLLTPETAIHWGTNYGAWRGGFSHKNNMGRMMVLSMLVLWAAAPLLRAYRPLVWVAFLLSLFLVAMSQSRTSWIVTVLLALSVPFLRYLRKSRGPMMVRIFLVALIGLGGIGYLALQYEDVGLQLIGRDATFTGRTDIWAGAIDIGKQRPILGAGYRSFWTKGLTNRLLVGNGHNSFLDLWLELGFVGLGVFLATFVVVTRRALRRLAESSDRRGLLYMMFLIFMVLFGNAALVFPDHGTIVWTLYVTIFLYLTPFAAESRPSRVATRQHPDAPAASSLPAE